LTFFTVIGPQACSQPRWQRPAAAPDKVGHGNLRSDGGQAVLSRALAQGGRSIDAVWFGLDRLPAVGGLAARYGD
jgi:hypothetical protein